MARLVCLIPTRGLLGYRSEFDRHPRPGVMNYVFYGYEPYVGDIRYRTRGAMVSMLTCKTVAYALFNLQERGLLFVAPVVDVYEGQIIGEHCREGDLIVNPAKGKN